MTLIMEWLCEEDLGGVGNGLGGLEGGGFIPEGAVILRGNGWCVTLCCVGQKHNSF